MKYNINLFGNNFDCELDIQDDNLTIALNQDNQKALKSYLSRVLLKYTEFSDAEKDSLELMINKAIQVEKNMGGRMSEPKLKLPYEFAPEVKEKLIECADLQDTSATQLLIRLIDQKYQEVMNND
ncbi:hypothetical protein ABFY57_00845 [Paenibacillus polymyxa]|uniref:hypothetical protein n=1 Tax=Paenibacillus polymyxa TaxID=1406 RepID=UPI000F864369|nr:hypothetical protein [Paenibacillus polymyxa]MEE4565882.1 hypothetical protein [Paenibacillus polymyxa]QDA30303.1 hypothetical protein FGY93_25645 [Paenibacillus polymyxa]RTZ29758.1 hypothetical protein EJ573_24825 [Paenibacillus polymyxa]